MDGAKGVVPAPAARAPDAGSADKKPDGGSAEKKPDAGSAEKKADAGSAEKKDGSDAEKKAPPTSGNKTDATDADKNSGDKKDGLPGKQDASDTEKKEHDDKPPFIVQRCSLAGPSSPKDEGQSGQGAAQGASPAPQPAGQPPTSPKKKVLNPSVSFEGDNGDPEAAEAVKRASMEWQLPRGSQGSAAAPERKPQRAKTQQATNSARREDVPDRGANSDNEERGGARTGANNGSKHQNRASAPGGSIMSRGSIHGGGTSSGAGAAGRESTRKSVQMSGQVQVEEVPSVREHPNFSGGPVPSARHSISVPQRDMSTKPRSASASARNRASMVLGSFRGIG